jgi:hypothetical protein
MVTGMDITEVLREDEYKLFSTAVNGLREQGFGEVTLCFRNGYVYRVKVLIDSYHQTEKREDKESG